MRPPPALTDADSVACLAEPAARGVRPGVQLVWNIRGVLVDLVNRNPTSPLSPQVFSEVYDRLPSMLAGVSGSRGAAASDLTPPVGTMVASPARLRASPLVLSDTVYGLPGDAIVIQTCVEQLLGEALAITDPVEQAIFLLTHLLYRQPLEIGGERSRARPACGFWEGGKPMQQAGLLHHGNTASLVTSAATLGLDPCASAKSVVKTD